MLFIGQHVAMAIKILLDFKAAVSLFDRVVSYMCRDRSARGVGKKIVSFLLHTDQNFPAGGSIKFFVRGGIPSPHHHHPVHTYGLYT